MTITGVLTDAFSVLTEGFKFLSANPILLIGVFASIGAMAVHRVKSIF